METLWRSRAISDFHLFLLMQALVGGQRRKRVGSHQPKKDRNRNGRRYYRGGAY